MGYEQLCVRKIQEHILQKTWEAGSELPSDTELSRNWKLHISRVKRVLFLLESQGWLEKRNSAYYVSDTPRLEALRWQFLQQNTKQYLADQLRNGFQKEEIWAMMVQEGGMDGVAKG